MRGLFEKAGIKTVFKTIYPPETADLTPIVAKVAAAKPDMVVGGTQSVDAYGQVNAMIQLKFNPKYLFLSNGANSPVEFPSKVGAGNVNGIFSCGDWFPDSKSAGNPTFVAAYLKKYGGNRLTIDSGSAEAYAVGQLIQAVAAKTNSVDNATIIKTLHKGVWPTIEGKLSWDANGSPKGDDSLVEWVGRKAAARLPGCRGAPRAHDPEAGLEGLGRPGTRTRAPPRPGVHPRSADRRRVCADGERPHAGLRRDAGGQRGSGGADRARRLPEPQPLRRPGHRSVRLDPGHDTGRLRAGRRAAARLPAPAAQR